MKKGIDTTYLVHISPDSTLNSQLAAPATRKHILPGNLDILCEKLLLKAYQNIIHLHFRRLVVQNECR